MPLRPLKAPFGKSNQWLRLAVMIAVIGAGLYGAWRRQQDQPGAPQPTAPARDPQAELPQITFENPPVDRTTITGQTIRDQSGRVAYRGDVDVRSTIARIDRNERLEFAHDGIVFQNRERRLPRKPAGYYREYVHPTPGLSGPGPQRIVRGQGGETYYTPDHYRTFQRLDQ